MPVAIKMMCFLEQLAKIDYEDCARQKVGRCTADVWLMYLK